MVPLYWRAETRSGDSRAARAGYFGVDFDVPPDCGADVAEAAGCGVALAVAAGVAARGVAAAVGVDTGAWLVAPASGIFVGSYG